MHFITTAIASLAITGAFAAPAKRGVHDIVVRLTGNGVPTWDAVGFSPDQALQATSKRNPGPFTNVQLFFSDSIKQRVPGIETRYRCALTDEDGNRIVVTRGENVDFNFGDNNNPNSWALKNGPFPNVKVTCDPRLTKINANNANVVRVQLSNPATESARQIEFDANEVGMRVAQSVRGEFTEATLWVGPGIDNQKLRCQLKDENDNNVLLNRGQNLNKETFGDGGKGAWKLDVSGDGRANIRDVVCDPAFK